MHIRAVSWPRLGQVSGAQASEQVEPWFFDLLKARRHSMTSSVSTELVNTADTSAPRIVWPSSGVITEPPITTGIFEPRFRSSWTNCGTSRMYSQE